MWKNTLTSCVLSTPIGFLGALKEEMEAVGWVEDGAPPPKRPPAGFVGVAYAPPPNMPPSIFGAVACAPPPNRLPAGLASGSFGAPPLPPPNKFPPTEPPAG